MSDPKDLSTEIENYLDWLDNEIDTLRENLNLNKLSDIKPEVAKGIPSQIHNFSWYLSELNLVFETGNYDVY